MSENLRHAAALALVGWYLMVPPLEYLSGNRPAGPYSRWTIADVFDSAADCKAKMKKVHDEGDAAVDQKYHAWLGNRAATDENLGEFTHGQWKQIAFNSLQTMAVCIATDDPRLKEK
jgi:hypothetical protein